MKKVVNIMLSNISNRLKKKNIEIDFDSNIDEFILSQMNDDSMGARPIRRIIQTVVEDKIVDEYIEGNIKEGNKIKLLQENDCIYIKNISQI